LVKIERGMKFKCNQIAQKQKVIFNSCFSSGNAARRFRLDGIRGQKRYTTPRTIWAVTKGRIRRRSIRD
jgi:hypothetical protein